MIKNNIAFSSPQFLSFAENFVKQNYPDEEFLVISTARFSQYIKSYLFKSFKKINRVLYFDYDLDLQKRNLIFALILFWLSKKYAYFIDLKGNKKRITILSLLFKYIPMFILEIFYIPFLIIKYKLIIRYIKKNTIKNFLKVKEKFAGSKNKKIVYFRTDHAFGVRAGGSVGHIKGVSESLVNLGKSLFFISTDELALIDKSKTPVYILKPVEIVNTIRELPELEYNFQFINKAEEIFNKEKPDMIYQRYSLNNFSGAYFALKYNIPFLLEYNGSFSWIARNWEKPIRFEKLSDNIEMINLNIADLIIVVSDQMEKELITKGIPKEKIYNCPNGVDIEIYNPDIDNANIKNKLALKDKITIGFISTFGVWHGAEVLARSVRIIIDFIQKDKEFKPSDIHFLFIGEGLLLEKVKDIINADKMSDYVTFTGLINQKEAPEYLSICDILVSPHVPNPDGTQFFGSPTKLFEYMAMAKGIVASNLGQIGKILENGKTAILVEPGNVNALADEILTLIKDKKLRILLGINARKEVIKKYTWQANVSEMMEFFLKKVQ